MKKLLFILLFTIPFLYPTLEAQLVNDRYDNYPLGTSLYDDLSRENSWGDIASQLHRYNPNGIDVLYVHDPAVYQALQSLSVPSIQLSNGLILNGTTGELGSPLIKNTSINTSTFDFDITNSIGIQIFNGNIPVANGTLNLPFSGGKTTLPDGRILMDGISNGTLLGGNWAYQAGAINPDNFAFTGYRYDYTNDEASLISSVAGGASNSKISVSPNNIKLRTTDVIAGNASAGDLWGLSNSDGTTERIDINSLPYKQDLLDDDGDTGFALSESGIGSDDQITANINGFKFMDMYNNITGIRTINLNVQDVFGLNMLSFSGIDTTTANTFGVVQEGSFIYDTNENRFMYNDGSKWKPIAKDSYSQDFTFDGMTNTIMVTDAPLSSEQDDTKVYIDGARIPSSEWNFSGNTIILITTPANGQIGTIDWNY